jgi:hypothetical protein
MKAIAVFVKKEESGILVPCRVFPAPDGATWQCGVCGAHPLLRASFGVMSGLWRCGCGAEVELMVDGQPVAIEDVAQLQESAPYSVQDFRRDQTRLAAQPNVSRQAEETGTQAE